MPRVYVNMAADEETISTSDDVEVILTVPQSLVLQGSGVPEMYTKEREVRYNKISLADEAHDANAPRR